jgi:hypothetical protein
MIAALSSRKTGNARPFLVSLTSTADAATGRAFPISTSLAATTKVFNTVELPGSRDGGERARPKRETERAFYTKTPGHNTFLINHETEKLPDTMPAPPGGSALATNLSDALHGEEFVTGGSNGVFDKWRIRRTGNLDVPYWNVRVHPSIIKNHGDIWNTRAQAMMAAIFRMTNPILNREVKPRAVLKQQPTRAKTIGPETNPSSPPPPSRDPAPNSPKPKPATNPAPEPPPDRTR